MHNDSAVATPVPPAWSQRRAGVYSRVVVVLRIKKHNVSDDVVRRPDVTDYTVIIKRRTRTETRGCCAAKHTRSFIDVKATPCLGRRSSARHDVTRVTLMSYFSSVSSAYKSCNAPACM